MASPIWILGSPLFAKDARGRLASRIATAFPRERALVTLPGIHATQRQAFVEALEKRRLEEGKVLLTRAGRRAVWESAVDLIVDEDVLLVRPDPDAMPLAFEADEMLHELLDPHRIRFLGLLNDKVREAIKRRGEWWRITPLPQSSEDMDRLVRTSRIGIGGREIYYYGRTTGTRFLTLQQFAGLAALDDAELARHLKEIQVFSRGLNAHGNPELSFFSAGTGFSRADFSGLDFSSMDPPALRACYEGLVRTFEAAVRPQLRVDDPRNLEWRNALVAALIGREHELVSEEALVGLSPEFFLQVEWLPGGRIDEGELVFDEVPAEHGAAVDEMPRKVIYNMVREYGDLEYVNIGRVSGSLSRRRSFFGRRGVYLAVLKQRQSRREIVSVIRMQKQGVREYLDDGYTRLEAMIRSEEYTEYTLDRLLACRQLGMRIPFHVTGKRISEWYGPAGGDGFTIWTPYFERDYVRGIATDKLPLLRLQDAEFALAFARLLGRAAAPNIIVGRCAITGEPLFDDGDEVLTLDAAGMPSEILVSDITGTFNDCATELSEFVAAYAAPVARRAAHLPDTGAFTATYLAAFVERFQWIQAEYRNRRRSFDTLFGHRPRSGAVAFGDRWQAVLARMDAVDARGLAAQVGSLVSSAPTGPAAR